MTEINPTVSVVIPTYNQGNLLRLALNAVVGQSFENWEALVVNNLSADNTAEVIAEFDDRRIHRIDFQNHGIIAASRNRAIAEARGEWVAFLDSDDLWMPEKLRRCLAAAGDADLISHREETFRGDKTLRVSPHRTKRDATYRQLLFFDNCFSPTAVLVRRAAIERVGRLSENPAFATAEDYELWLRLIRSGARVQFIDDVLSKYRLHDANNSASVTRHMHAGLNVVADHFQRHEPKRPFDRLRFRRKRASIIYAGGRSLQNCGNRVAAITQFGRSLAVYPLFLKSYAAVVLTCLGAK